MNWYVAKLVFRIIICGNSSDKGQFDEQLWLVSAPNETEALLKARKKGLFEQSSFQGKDTGTVSWQFIDVSELTELGDIDTDMAIHSRIEETDDLKGYLLTVKRKAELIEQEQLFANINTYA